MPQGVPEILFLSQSTRHAHYDHVICVKKYVRSHFLKINAAKSWPGGRGGVVPTISGKYKSFPEHPVGW